MAGVGRYFAIDPSGEWLGAVNMPARFRLLDASEQYVLGVQRDEFDVEHIAAYELVGGNE